MTETTIPLTHIQMWLTILGLFITTSGLGAAAAGWGAKLALKSFSGQIDAIKDSIKREAEANDRRFKGIIDSQNERKILFTDLNREVQRRVLESRCHEDRTLCGDNRDSVVCAISKQVAALAEDLKYQDEKRQQAVQENANMFTEIKIHLAVLTKTSQSLETLILERQHDFRPPTGKDLIS